MDPWYKIAIPRKEVREGRSFNPDEFAIHLEQVIAGTAPEDYRDPKQFFLRTCFTRALREHTGMVLRRLSGETANTAPVMTLITQFGGGKTHTLAALYHLVTNGSKASEYPGEINTNQCLPGCGCPCVTSLRRGIEFPEPASWHGRPIPCFFAKPDGSSNWHNPLCCGHQLAQKPG